MPIRMIGHDAVALDKVQDSLQVQAGSALAALDVLDTPSPARATCRPLVPEAHDKGAGRRNGGWLNHDYPLPCPPREGAARSGPGIPLRAQPPSERGNRFLERLAEGGVTDPQLSFRLAGIDDKALLHKGNLVDGQIK
jgi:hypothetical protein